MTRDGAISLPSASQTLHEAAWPDMLASLQTSYAELSQTRFELERRAAEVEETRDLFQQVIASMSEALFLLDRGGRVVRTNPAAARLLACREEEIAGRLLADVTGSADIPATPWRLLEHSPDGTLVDLELDVRTATAETVPVSVSCVLVRDKWDKIDGVLVVARDITERRRLERERAALYEAELEAARMRDQFLSAAAHDLKTPLAGIKGIAQLSRRRAERAGTPESESLAQNLVSIDRAATRMTALINEMLDVTRLQMGRPIDLDLKRLDLVALARDVVAEHQQTARRHQILLETTASEVVGHWDPTRLQRVLDNLIGNAVKYSPSGGNVSVAVDVEDGAAVLSVRDQGIGIPPADLPRVFERFHRAANAVGTVSGTGIGLASAKAIAESHGGVITAESQEGHGSTFTVRLPLAPPMMQIRKNEKDGKLG